MRVAWPKFQIRWYWALPVLFLCTGCLFSLSTKDELEVPPTPIGGSYVLNYDNVRNNCVYEEVGGNEFRVTCSAVAVDSSGTEHVPSGVEAGLVLRFEDPTKLFGADYSLFDCGEDKLKRCYTVQLDEVVSTKLQFPLVVSAPNKNDRTENEDVLIPFSIQSIGLMPEFPAQYRTVAQTTRGVAQGSTLVPVVQQGFENISLPLRNLSAVFDDICFRGNDAYLLTIGGQSGGFIYRIRGSINPQTQQHELSDQVQLYAGSVNFGNQREFSHRLRLRFGTEIRMACHPRGIVVVDREVTPGESAPSSLRASLLVEDGSVEKLIHWEQNNPVSVSPPTMDTIVPVLPVVTSDGKIYVTGKVYGTGTNINGYYRIDGPNKLTRIASTNPEDAFPPDVGMEVTPGLLYFARMYAREFQTVNVRTGAYSSVHFTEMLPGEPDFHLGGALSKDSKGKLFVAAPFSGNAVWHFENGKWLHYMGHPNTGLAGDGQRFDSLDVRIRISQMRHAPDDSLYFIQGDSRGREGRALRKVSKNGVLSTVFQTAITPVADGQKVLPTETVFFGIQDVELGPNGDIYYAATDEVDYNFTRIRKISANGTVTTIAGAASGELEDGPAINQIGRTGSLHLGQDGMLYITDAQRDYVRRIDQLDGSGSITTIVNKTYGLHGRSTGFSGDGGPATEARLFNVTDTVTDQNGNLYVADLANKRIRKVDTDGIISTYLGARDANWNCIGGGICPHSPNSLAIDSQGFMWIADGGVYYSNAGNRILKVDMRATPPQVVAVAGDGTPGLRGDGENSRTAHLLSPNRIATDSLGRVYFIDQTNTRVRMLEPISGEGLGTQYTITTLFGGSSAMECGSGTIEGFSSVDQLSSNIRSSLSVICSAYIQGLDVRDNCGLEGGQIRLVMVQRADSNYPISNITQITRPCE